LLPEPHPAIFSLLNSLELALSTQFSFELGNGTEHVKQQSPGGIARVDGLIQHPMRPGFSG
jgi:hypothetical protein